MLERGSAELLPEGVSARMGEVMEEGEEPHEARLLAEPRCWDRGRCGVCEGEVEAEVAALMQGLFNNENEFTSS